jgi:hypothetical protein
MPVLQGYNNDKGPGIAFRIFTGVFSSGLFSNHTCSGLFGLFAPCVEREQA